VDYLKGRGLSGVIARDFGLGFAPPGWDNLLKAPRRRRSPRARPSAPSRPASLVRNDAGRVYDRFRDRIVSRSATAAAGSSPSAAACSATTSPST
jgi:DNA primase